MIIYDGTDTINKINLIRFKNENGSVVRIPLSADVFKYIIARLDTIQPKVSKPVDPAEPTRH